MAGDRIAREADKHIGSSKYSLSSWNQVPTGTPKCNIFVSDALKGAGAPAPTRTSNWTGSQKPIGANEWGNQNSSYLKNDPNWGTCTGGPQKGDVVATGGHVGIVTGPNQTTSASTREDKVVKNDWGFRQGQTPACHRYTGDRK